MLNILYYTLLYFTFLQYALLLLYAILLLTTVHMTHRGFWPCEMSRRASSGRVRALGGLNSWFKVQGFGVCLEFKGLGFRGFQCRASAWDAVDLLILLDVGSVEVAGCRR